MSFLIKLFGSKKLAAIIGGILATVLTPVLNAKLNLHMDDIELASVLGVIASMVLTYVAAQWHIDVKTEGASTTARMLTHIASPSAPGPLPPQVLSALTIALMFLPEGDAKAAVQKALDEYKA